MTEFSYVKFGRIESACCQILADFERAALDTAGVQLGKATSRAAQFRSYLSS